MRLKLDCFAPLAMTVRRAGGPASRDWRAAPARLRHIGVDVGVLAAICAAFDEGAIAGATDIIAFVDHDLAARQHGLGVALHLEAFIGAVVDIGVMGPAVKGADHLFARRIEDHDVGIAADGDGALFRKQAENLRRRGRGQLDEAIERDMPLADAIMVDQAHAALDAGTAVGNLAEVVAPQFLLLLEAERAMVGRDDIERV